ncbi:MAG: hypothetical protein U5J83_10715 [Bryobacterales bacterium]|nr:hypothetical protein [Bryobacterales bacterium]
MITPERKLLDQFVARVTLPEADGYVTLLPGHAALVGEVGDGDLVYEVRGKGTACCRSRRLSDRRRTMS